MLPETSPTPTLTSQDKAKELWNSVTNVALNMPWTNLTTRSWTVEGSSSLPRIAVAVEAEALVEEEAALHPAPDPVLVLAPVLDHDLDPKTPAGAAQDLVAADDNSALFHSKLLHYSVKIKK